jgi:uncharacterized phage protein (TIGR01671 family)
MREIKFRAWHKVHREWLSDPIINQYISIIAGEFITPTNVILNQFTGLLDKNGKEIYEGDRLDGIMGDGYIGYCEKCKSFEFFGDDFGCYACSGDFYWSEAVDLAREIEVIGNIYENTNLRMVKEIAGKSIS